MALNSVPILTAVKEVVLGTIGTIRTVTPGVFEYGKHAGLNDEELARNAFVKPLFDVEMLTAQRTGTTMGIMGNFGIYQIALLVSVVYWLNSEALDSARETARASALNDGDVIMQALTFPRNLAYTSGGVATRIVSGMLHAPDGVRIAREDPNENLLITEIPLVGHVNVLQAVA